MPYSKLAFLALGIAATMLAADPTAGTWKLNVTKSKYEPGPPPKSATITFKETAAGIHRTGEMINADGSKLSFEYTAKYDGKDYPIKGTQVYDAIAIHKIDDQTSEATLKRAGKVVAHAKRVLSKDGKTMTLTNSGTTPKGDKFTNVSLYEKQ